MRRYAPAYLIFRHSQIRKLEKLGYVESNPGSRWSSPILVVPKPKSHNDSRMAVETWYPNSQIVPVAGSLPNMDVILQYLRGSKLFASLDAFKGF
jgi:hypothetical protein